MKSMWREIRDLKEELAKLQDHTDIWSRLEEIQRRVEDLEIHIGLQERQDEEESDDDDVDDTDKDDEDNSEQANLYYPANSYDFSEVGADFVIVSKDPEEPPKDWYLFGGWGEQFKPVWIRNSPGSNRKAARYFKSLTDARPTHETLLEKEEEALGNDVVVLHSSEI